MSEHRSHKKSQLESFKLFYQAVPIPEIHPNRDLIGYEESVTRVDRDKRVARSRH